MAHQKVNPTTGRHALQHPACTRCGATTTGWNLCSNGLCVACDALAANPTPGRMMPNSPGPGCQLCGSSSFPLGPGGFCQSCYLQTTGSAGWHQTAVLPGGWVITGGGGGAAGGNRGAVVVGPLVGPGAALLYPGTAGKALPRDDLRLVDLIGWRIWRVTGAGYLRSLAAEAIWLPGEPMEAAEVTDHGAALNGVHVFADRAGAVKEMTTHLDRRQGLSFALGSVLLWGDVVEHERGYRAERAKILSIDDVVWEGKPPWDAETKRALAFLRERYGVGVGMSDV